MTAIQITAGADGFFRWYDDGDGPEMAFADMFGSLTTFQGGRFHYVGGEWENEGSHNDGSYSVTAVEGASGTTFQSQWNGLVGVTGVELTREEGGQTVDVGTVTVPTELIVGIGYSMHGAIYLGQEDGGSWISEIGLALKNYASDYGIEFEGSDTFDIFDLTIYKDEIQAGVTLRGNAGDDSLKGTTSADSIDGGDDDDVIDGEGDADTIEGGKGNDFIRYSDEYETVGATIEGGNGSDTIEATDYFNGADDLASGGAGDDLIDLALGDDTVTGDGGDDTINAGGGDDQVNGGNGDDELNGEDGNDNVKGSNGDDLITGGDGDDTLNGGDGDDDISGDEGDDLLNGREGDDTLEGGTDDDTLNGNEGNDIIRGGSGSDILKGHDDNDDLNGGAGADSLKGGQGRDTLTGGAGDDTLTGNANADIFIFDSATGTDEVTDFKAGTDVITLDTAVFTALTSGALSSDNFVAGTVAQDADDFLIYDQTTGALYYDEDGSGAGAHVQIAEFSNLTALSVSDFDLG